MVFQLMDSDAPAKSHLWRVRLALCSSISNLPAKNRKGMILYTDEMESSYEACAVYFQIHVPENTEAGNDYKSHLACPYNSLLMPF